MTRRVANHDLIADKFGPRALERFIGLSIRADKCPNGRQPVGRKPERNALTSVETGQRKKHTPHLVVTLGDRKDLFQGALGASEDFGPWPSS
jgi:hypothetical protein